MTQVFNIQHFTQNNVFENNSLVNGPYCFISFYQYYFLPISLVLFESFEQTNIVIPSFENTKDRPPIINKV